MPSTWSFLVSNPRWSLKKSVCSVPIRCAAPQMSVWPSELSVLFEACISLMTWGLGGQLVTERAAMRSPNVIVEMAYFT